MNLVEFQSSLSQAEPPRELALALQALWCEARGDWDRAHQLAQQEGGIAGDWVHAYLHRKEGDQANARYWYARAQQPVFIGTLEAEWTELVTALLHK